MFAMLWQYWSLVHVQGQSDRLITSLGCASLLTSLYFSAMELMTGRIRAKVASSCITAVRIIVTACRESPIRQAALCSKVMMVIELILVITITNDARLVFSASRSIHSCGLWWRVGSNIDDAAPAVCLF